MNDLNRIGQYGVDENQNGIPDAIEWQDPVDMPQAPQLPALSPLQDNGYALPPVMSQRDMGLDQIYNALGNFSGMGGQSPWAQQHAGELQNYKMANARLAQLHQDRIDRYKLQRMAYEDQLQADERSQLREDYEFEMSQLPEQERISFTRWKEIVGTVGAGDPSAVREYKFFQGLDAQGKQAYQALKRSGNLETLPDGRVVMKNPDGSVTELYGPKEMQEGAGQLSGAKQAGQEGAKNVTADFNTGKEQFLSGQDTVIAADRAIQMVKDAGEILESGNADTGFVTGLMAKYLGVGSSELAQLMSLSTEAGVAAIKDSGLSPVTDSDFNQLKSLFGDVSENPEMVAGRLLRFLKSKERTRKEAMYDIKSGWGKMSAADGDRATAIYGEDYNRWYKPEQSSTPGATMRWNPETKQVEPIGG